MEKNFYQRYIELKNEIKVPKTKDNKFGNFKYRNLEQIQETLKPLELKHNILFFSTEDTVIMEDNTRHCVATLEVIDALTGEKKLTTKSSAQYQKDDSSTKMNASQLSGSASSYATKYAYARALGLDDTKDADDEDLTEKKPQIKSQVVVKKEEPQPSGELNISKFLTELKESTIKMQKADEINHALEQLKEVGGDKNTQIVISMRAKQLGLKQNIKTGKFENIEKEKE